MALADWYFHKAEQCGALAKAAGTAKQRASHRQDQKLWLQIANKSVSDDDEESGPGPRLW
jgi:hypothetical protein